MARTSNPNSNFLKSEIKPGFADKTVNLTLDKIIFLKTINPGIRKNQKYNQIMASIKEVGIIEPPVVSHKDSKYILLDGHIRIDALKELGVSEVTCIVSTDDEAFTYNKHISRLSTVMEHKMILRAIERGVSEIKIAKALNIDVKSIIVKRDLLNGICPEAAELLKDKMINLAAFPFLRRMKSLRQIEEATLMNDANIYSRTYARMLLAATPKDQLVNADKPKNIKGLDEDQIARMESEMESLQREYKLIEDNYGKDVLNMTLTKGYLGALIANARVVRYLAQNHPDILGQFQKIADISHLSKEAIS